MARTDIRAFDFDEDFFVEAVQKQANVILNGAKRSEPARHGSSKTAGGESASVNQILRPAWKTAGLRMTFWSASMKEMPRSDIHSICHRT
jgi:hypothetical protein